MRTHYVYRITKKNTIEEKVHYIGKHSGLLDDLHTMKYTTSSKHISPIFTSEDWKIKIVKIFKTAKEAVCFESKYHYRVDAARNPKFYNESNQTPNGKFDRTDLLTVHDKIDDKRRTITRKEYHESRDRFDSICCDKVLAKDVTSGEVITVTKEEFHSNNNLVGINKGLMHVKEKSTGNKVTITCDEYATNKELYIHTFSKIVVYDTILQIKCTIDKSMFDKERYVGIKAFTKEYKHVCPVCKKEVSSSNLERHIKTHNTRKFYVTDKIGYNTYFCDEYTYYTFLADEWQVAHHDGVIDGKLVSLKYIGRLNRHLPDEVQDDIKIKKDNLDSLKLKTVKDIWLSEI